MLPGTGGQYYPLIRSLDALFEGELIGNCVGVYRRREQLHCRSLGSVESVTVYSPPLEPIECAHTLLQASLTHDSESDVSLPSPHRLSYLLEDSRTVGHLSESRGCHSSLAAVSC